MFEALMNDCQIALPLLGWALLGLLALCVRVFFPGPSGIRPSLFVTLLGLIGLIVFSAMGLQASTTHIVFQNTIRIDSSFYVFNLLGLMIHLAVTLMLVPGLDKKTKLFEESYEHLPELLICLLFSGFGFSVLTAAFDLSTLFLGLETLSIAAYCLCGFYRSDIRSTESAFKYLMIGAFSTVLFLYGLAFLYGATANTHYLEMQGAIAQLSASYQPLLMLAIVFLVAAFGFKLAFVPFHLYTPDVYAGAPTPITAYLATAIKVGVIAAAAKIFWIVLQPAAIYWEPFWLGLCVLSILLGNILALQQRSLKKLLAYSSISHSGFLGLALFTSGSGNLYPMMAYLFVYSAISLGLFAIISSLEDRASDLQVDDLRGLGQKKFWPAFFMSIFVLGLAGLPPFAGFMIKFWVLESLIQQNYILVAVAAIIGSLIGAAYYLRILMLVFMSDDVGLAAQGEYFKDRFYLVRLIVFLAAVLTVLGGMRPQVYADWILSTLALK